MRTSHAAGTFLTLLFLLSIHITAIGGTPCLSYTASNHPVPEVDGYGITHLNSDTLKRKECVLLIELAQRASRRGDLRRARSNYLKAFTSTADSETQKYLLTFLPEVSVLYTRIAQTDSALYDSLRSEPYSWKNYYFKVTRIEEVGTSDDRSYFAHINAPASFNLSDEVITIYGALGTGESERELSRIAEGDLVGKTDSTTYYKLRGDVANSNWKVVPGDLLVVEHKGPAFEGDILANAYLNQVRFRDNYRVDPMSLSLLLTSDYPVYRPYLEDLFHEQIAEIYELYRDDSIPVLQEVMREGLFTGITGMQALGRSSKREESQFIRYASEHLGSYMGKSFKFSEAYATWIIQNAPMSDEQYRDYFLSFTDSSRIRIVEGYIKQIQKKELLKKWIGDSENALIDHQLPMALSLVELCLEIAALTGNDLQTAELFLLQARIYLEFNQDQRSLKLA